MGTSDGVNNIKNANFEGWHNSLETYIKQSDLENFQFHAFGWFEIRKLRKKRSEFS